jgi:anti-anti-sigma factor
MSGGSAIFAHTRPVTLGGSGTRQDLLPDTGPDGWVPPWPRSYLIQLILVGAAYYVAARLSLRISLVGGVVTPIWPPTGIAVVALLWFGLRVWPAITLAALLVNLPINDAIGSAVLIAIGNTTAPLLAVWLLRTTGFRLELDRLRDALALVFLGALAAMTVSATFGATALLLDDAIAGGSYASTWALWWAGDGTGVLVFAPLLLCLGQLRRLTWLRALETAVVIGGLVGVAYLVFHSQTQDAYLVFPFLIWAAVRFRQLGAALAAVTVVVMGVWAAVDQAGPFAHLTFLHRVLTLQIYDAVVALTSFVLAAVMAEREKALTDVEASLEREHRIAETLQRSLLPERLPDIPGVAFASRYLPGGAGLKIGGDWYDVFPLARGRIAVTVGDVVGRGLGAAAAMGQLRTAVRAYALETASPAGVLDHTSRLVGEIEAAQMATLLFAVLDPESGTLTYASAGHPPPLLLGPDGQACYLEDGRSPPLGLVTGARLDAVTTIEPGSTLILYTDGLVERRGLPLDESLEMLRHDVEGHLGDLDSLCDERVLRDPRPESPDDDVAVLMVRLKPVSSGALSLALPAEPDMVASVRRALRSWAVQWGPTRDEIDDLAHAVSEAANNVVEHAYGPTGGLLEVQATCMSGVIRVVVRDHGDWRSRRNDGQGRGLQLIRALVDQADVVHTTDGTEIHLIRRLGSAPVTHGVTIPDAARAPAPERDARVAVVQLSGDLDLPNSARLYHDVIGQVEHDDIGLVLDLSGVEFLDSAGMRLLYRLAGRLGPRRQALRIVATVGSPVRRVLQMSGFDSYAPMATTVDAAVAAMRTADASIESLDPST